MSRLLEVERLRVNYGAVVAVDDVTLHVDEGEVVGLIGPNGAGKSSFIDALTGGIKRSRRPVRLEGRPIDGLPPYRGQPPRASRGPSSRSSCSATSPSRRTCGSAPIGRRCATSFRDLVLPVEGARPRGRRLGHGSSAASRRRARALPAPSSATGGASSPESPGRSPCGRGWCCWTSRPPASTPRRASRSDTASARCPVTASACCSWTTTWSSSSASATASTSSTSARVIASGTPAEIRNDPDGDRGLPRERSCRLTPEPVLEITGLVAGYNGLPVVRDLDLVVRTRRGRRAARRQRRGQDHHAALDRRAAEADLGHDPRRRRQHRRHVRRARAGAAGRRARPRGPRDLRRPHDPREPARRRHEQGEGAGGAGARPAARAAEVPAAARRATSPAASSRCSPSAGRSSAQPRCSSSTR